MAMRFVRELRTASVAPAVQILNHARRTVTDIEHIDSANTNAELGVFLTKDEQVVRPGWQAFDFGDVEQLPVWTSSAAGLREFGRLGKSLDTRGEWEVVRKGIAVDTATSKQAGHEVTYSYSEVLKRNIGFQHSRTRTMTV